MIKTRVKFYGKISIFWRPKVRRFLKGLRQDFCQKFELFIVFFLWKRVLKMSFDEILDTKQTFWTLIITFPKVPKFDMILVTFFFMLFVFYWLALKMWLRDLPDRKQALLDDKDIYFLKSRNWSFFKGVNPWFFSKIELFLLIVLMQIRNKNIAWGSSR